MAKICKMNLLSANMTFVLFLESHFGNQIIRVSINENRKLLWKKFKNSLNICLHNMRSYAKL